MSRNIEDHVGYHILLSAHFIQNLFNEKLSEFDLTTSQAKVLYQLVKHGDLLQSEIQKKLYIQASTMNGIIDSLLKKHLIEKLDSDKDRRSKIIVLTEKGRALEEKLWNATEDIDNEISGGFSNEEKQQFLKWMKLMTDHLHLLKDKER